MNIFTAIQKMGPLKEQGVESEKDDLDRNMQEMLPRQKGLKFKQGTMYNI